MNMPITIGVRAGVAALLACAASHLAFGQLNCPRSQEEQRTEISMDLIAAKMAVSPNDPVSFDVRASAGLLAGGLMQFASRAEATGAKPGVFLQFSETKPGTAKFLPGLVTALLPWLAGASETFVPYSPGTKPASVRIATLRAAKNSPGSTLDLESAFPSTPSSTIAGVLAVE